MIDGVVSALSIFLRNEVSHSTPMHVALRECIQQHVGGASLFDQVETVVKSHFPRLEAAVVTAKSQSKLSRHLLVTRKLKVYDEEIGPQVPLLVGPAASQLNRETSEVSGPPEETFLLLSQALTSS